jgi:hypothetical protein
MKCCPILTENGTCQQILVKLVKIKFNKNPFSRYGAVLCVQTDSQSEGRIDINRRPAGM